MFAHLSLVTFSSSRSEVTMDIPFTLTMPGVSYPKRDNDNKLGRTNFSLEYGILKFEIWARKFASICTKLGYFLQWREHPLIQDKYNNELEESIVYTIAILNPSPVFPRRFSLGMRQSSNMRLQVDEPLIPILSSFFPLAIPSEGSGTMKQLIPLCFFDLSVVAKT
ncbi:UNVERIFIED_CONTAM: hypothetical protein NCL1_12107 [Trichonephila clavipes]